jgi:sugar-specific transcriptional regulator TrmB
MYEKILNQVGLSPKEAQVYEALLKVGEAIPQALASETGLNRVTTYAVLDTLSEKKIVSKIKKGGKITYRIEHPAKLEEILSQKEETLFQNKKSLEQILPKLVSDYNLNVYKPIVKYYEGLEGVKLVINDSLKSKTPIYSYVDVENVARYFEKENRKYVNKRKELGLKKKIIALDSPFTKRYLKKLPGEITDTRLINYELYPFHTVMQIYDNKISYLTLSKKHMVGMIIEDPYIFAMHKSLFEFTWQKAQKVT